MLYTSSAQVLQRVVGEGCAPCSKALDRELTIQVDVMREPSNPSQRVFTHVCVRVAVSLVAVCVWSSTATATTIQVTTTPDFASANLAATGTYSLNVTSVQNRSSNPPTAPAGPNATTTYTTVLGGTPGTGTLKPGPSIIEVLTGVIGGNAAQSFYGEKAKQSVRSQAFGPTVSTGLQSKGALTRAGDNATITSTSGMYSAEASAFISAKGVRGLSVSTSISGTPPAVPTGQAAAQANDPYSVPSGIYAYQPTLTATLDLDLPGVAGGFSDFAVDSSTFTSDSLDNFANDGSPIDQTLWYLSVGGTVVDGQPTALIDFQLNPLALNEIQFDSSFLAELGPYSDAASEALLINSAIDSFITSQMTSDGSSLDFNDVDVFPDNTTFQPIDGGVQYANGIDALVIPVSEPASLSIVGAGLLGLAALRRLKRNCSFSGCAKAAHS